MNEFEMGNDQFQTSKSSIIRTSIKMILAIPGLIENSQYLIPAMGSRQLSQLRSQQLELFMGAAHIAGKYVSELGLQVD